MMKFVSGSRLRFTYDVEAFREEYVALCLKHGFEIDGCGCCGSLWIARNNGAIMDGPVPTIVWPKEVNEEADDIRVWGQSPPPEFKM